MTQQTMQIPPIPSKPLRYLKRADVLLKLVDELTYVNGRTVAHLQERVGFSHASIYRFLKNLRDLGISPIRHESSGRVRYSLPAGSQHRLAIRLARVVVFRTGIDRLLQSYDAAIACAETPGYTR